MMDIPAKYYLDYFLFLHDYMDSVSFLFQVKCRGLDCSIINYKLQYFVSIRLMLICFTPRDDSKLTIHNCGGIQDPLKSLHFAF